MRSEQKRVEHNGVFPITGIFHGITSLPPYPQKLTILFSSLYVCDRRQSVNLLATNVLFVVENPIVGFKTNSNTNVEVWLEVGKNNLRTREGL